MTYAETGRLGPDEYVTTFQETRQHDEQVAADRNRFVARIRNLTADLRRVRKILDAERVEKGAEIESLRAALARIQDLAHENGSTSLAEIDRIVREST